MKRWQKIGIVVLGVIILSQLPFACRRHRLKRLNDSIQQLASQRIPPQTSNPFRDVKGVIHVHSFLGGHSTGTFEAIVGAAKTNQLDFVIMTEHPAKDYDTAAMTLNGLHSDTLFINGNEVSTDNGNRLLLIPGSSTAALASGKPTASIVEQQKPASGLALIAYPAEFKNWDQAGAYDGIEVYNVFTNARRMNPVVTFFDGLWSLGSYPDLMFANFYERPSAELQAWDRAIAASQRRLVATAGNDAHANIGLSFNDSSGKRIIGLKLDPYERSFRLVRTHVLLRQDESLMRESLLSAIAAGHCYLSFDLFADPVGFEFTAHGETEVTMGDEISLGNGVKLAVKLPVPGRIVLFKDGGKVQEESGVSQKEFSVTEAGAYRVEAYLPQLPHPVSAHPWIISNPIYVK